MGPVSLLRAAPFSHCASLGAVRARALSAMGSQKRPRWMVVARGFAQLVQLNSEKSISNAPPNPQPGRRPVADRPAAAGIHHASFHA
ncbi:uncharacterized protein K460DRAFT_16134 [Cucurbitaria berberidis CBS 394.84]|uniref:Uncharacterized protein n=1 Tax=Cucurbitaria berberidis CBS 394.84 TaxID=1168544 RepID=A0A9P4LC96_9PLEO|nr:uncharacterized protein K460DRAFT_16134 [Cucurbitaria berberidis CBS 394.84]KAF1850476.1 hypothetical protein K460DRAFT_16134 [Cucurbitaria berberidis CBS 394.84]